MDPMTNPFPAADPDRRAIWEMLVTRDIDAFLGQDWSMVEGDFVAEGFLGINAHGSDIPDSWRVGSATSGCARRPSPRPPDTPSRCGRRCSR